MVNGDCWHRVRSPVAKNRICQLKILNRDDKGNLRAMRNVDLFSQNA